MEVFEIATTAVFQDALLQLRPYKYSQTTYMKEFEIATIAVFLDALFEQQHYKYSPTRDKEVFEIATTVTRLDDHPELHNLIMSNSFGSHMKLQNKPAK